GAGLPGRRDRSHGHTAQAHLGARDAQEQAPGAAAQEAREPAALSLLHTRRFSSWIRGHLLCRVDDVPDRLALTFDDGPSIAWTPRVLDVLARHGAHATFFTLAHQVDRRPQLVGRMVAEGHEVALHGDLHWPLPMLTPGLLRREIRRSAEAVARAAGVTARHYRPPFGFMLPSQARFVGGLGYASVLGDVFPADVQRPGVNRTPAPLVRG